MTKLEIASYIDHTLLAPEAGVKQIQQLCTEAINYKFASVCINPCYVPYAATTLAGTGTATGTAAGFRSRELKTEQKTVQKTEHQKRRTDRC